MQQTLTSLHPHPRPTFNECFHSMSSLYGRHSNFMIVSLTIMAVFAGRDTHRCPRNRLVMQ